MRSIRRPGRGDDDVDALGERLDLLLHVGAAVDGDDARRRAPRRAARARRAPGWRARGSARARGRAGGGARPCRCVSRSGQAEGERLARAGLGLAAHVAAGEGVGDGERLDREGLGDASARRGPSTRSADTPSASNVVVMWWVHFRRRERSGSASATPLRHERRTVRMTRQGAAPPSGGAQPLLAGDRLPACGPKTAVTVGGQGPPIITSRRRAVERRQAGRLASMASMTSGASGTHRRAEAARRPRRRATTRNFSKFHWMSPAVAVGVGRPR